MTRRLLIAGTLFGVLLGPAITLMGLATVMNPAAQASCLTTTPFTVGAVPDRLAATTSDGITVSLDKEQLTHAATIVGVGGQIRGVGRDGVLVALMAALTESSLRMLSNTGAYPASAEYPNDGDGADHDSLGLFQMRASMGWGTVADLMDPVYQARAFFGGPSGPNHGSPAGLLDIPGWQGLPKGAAAQGVEDSAYPDRYARFEPVAQAILDALTRSASNGSGDVPESGRVVFPLPPGSWVRTSGFGMRVHPITGERKLHTGVDFAAAEGTPISAAADGRVAFAGPASGYGNLILIEHTIDGRSIVSGYAHMYATTIDVQAGDVVTAGQHIADVGAAGYATGPHLHFEIRPGGPDAAPVGPEPWLADHHATSIATASTVTDAGCGDGPDAVPAGNPAPYADGDPNRMVDDPTSDGQITARTAYALAQVRTHFPSTAWACWSQRSGPSEHPLGRACDGTFGNSIGTAATGPALDLGWAVTNWLKAHARTLGVEYLIWQGRIWSDARADEGWRLYDGGGMHDPSAVTGGHYDHLHFTVTDR